MPPKTRNPPSPRRHELSSDDDDLSDLSDLDDQYNTTTTSGPRPGVPTTTDDEDEDEEEEEEDEDEEDPETPDDAEDSYISPDDATSPSASDSYEEDDDGALAGKPNKYVKSGAVRGAAAASAKSTTAARRAAAKPTKSRKPPVSPSSSRRKPVGQPTAASGGLRRATRVQTQQSRPAPTSPRTTRSSYTDFAQTGIDATATREHYIVTLKIGKEKLRAATSRWTPEPRATNDYRAPTGPNARLPQLPPRAAARKPPQSYESDPSPSEDDEDAEGEEDDMMLDQDDDEDVQMADVTNIDNDMGVDIDAEGEDDLDDAEGEDEELVDEDAEGETDDDMMDSDGDTGMDISRTGTPGDMSRLTNRQRTRMGDITTADHLLELPSGYGKSNTNKDLALTAQEQELKRAEMARRRKHLTDQRLHEEKMDTINRLLKKQTPKMRGSRGTVGEAATPAGGGGNESETLAEKPPPPNMLRWVSRKDGNFVAVPESWLDAPVGQVFMKQERTPRMRKLVEEID